LSSTDCKITFLAENLKHLRRLVASVAAYPGA